MVDGGSSLFADRRKKLKHALGSCGVYAALINAPSNLAYFTGFTGGEAFFVMDLESEDGYVITDSRYYEQVEMECAGLTLVKLGQKNHVEAIREVIGGFEPQGASCKIAIEDALKLNDYLKLTGDDEEYNRSDGCRLVICSTEINGCRMVKDDGELEKLRRAEAIGDAAFSQILELIRPGVTEARIALELEYAMKKMGASGLSFDTIVASGSHSSMPHAKVTGRRLERGDFITMDFGCVYEGYCSDMTRTVALGEPSEEMRRVYQTVLEANYAAVERIKAGTACNEIDRVARNYIAEHGYGEYFGHGLGHGVGLEIHEEPRFSPKCEVVTEKNMVITVEPGIYLPGRFGVRIEDLVVVKEDGCELLSHSDRELIVLS